MQILVLGMHRSGTSLITRLINMMGAYISSEGQTQGFTKDNPKGFWERKDVMALNDNLLRAYGCEWDRLEKWPVVPTPTADSPLAQSIKLLILGMDLFRPWVMKDPRHCLTLPAWLPHMELPVAVIVYRDPLEVAQSLITRDKMPPEYALALWEYYAVSMLNASRDLPRIFASHRDALADPVGFTAQLHDALVEKEVRKLSLPSPREILAFVDPQLYRSHAEGSLKLSPAQQQLCAVMQGKQPQPGTLSVSPESAALIRSGRA